MPNQTFHRLLELTALLAILLLAAYLRFDNLADNPGWYTDEATHVDIARHLVRGEVRYMAVGQSTLLFARPPLFHNLLAVLFRIFGEGITTLRTFTATLGMLTIGLLYGALRRMTADRVFALLAALLLAIYPRAVVYHRLGFSYNLLPPLVILALWGLWAYLNGRRSGLALAALMIGLGITCDLTASAFVPVLILVVAYRNWRDLLWSVPLLALPFGIYTALMLLTVPDAFLFDLGYTLRRLGDVTLLKQIDNLANNYTILVSQDSWIVVGVIGMFVIPLPRLRTLSGLLFFVPVLVMGRTAALHTLSFYYMIPLLIFVAMGMAALVRYGVPYLARWVSAGLSDYLDRLKLSDSIQRIIILSSAALVILIVVISPLLTTTVSTIHSVEDGFSTVIDPFLINADDARAVADFINVHTESADLVIASPAVGWQFDAQAADFLMSVAYNGQDTPHMPGYTPKDRYVFDPDYTNARYVVVDNLWRNWGAVHVPLALAMLHEVETWPLAFEVGSIQVYRNPNVAG